MNLTGENYVQECLVETEHIAHYKDNKTRVVLVAFMPVKEITNIFIAVNLYFIYPDGCLCPSLCLNVLIRKQEYYCT